MKNAPPAEVAKKPSAPQIKIRPARPASPAKRERDGSERRRQTEKQPETFENWQDKILGQIFRVTLKEGQTKDFHGNPLTYLASTKEDLPSDDHRLNVDVLEGAITEAASHQAKPFEYLLSSFKRAARSIRQARYAGAEQARQDVLGETKRLCVSYCIFAVTMPEMFGENVPSGNPLVDHLLLEPECDTGICTDFLTEASSRFEEDESIKEAFVGAVELLSTQLSSKSLLSDYQGYVRAMRSLVRFPKIIDALTQSPNWLSDGLQPQELETNTLLGPYFRLSPMQLDVAREYFSSPRTRDRGFISNSQNAARASLRTHQSELFHICDAIVRAGAVTRGKMLDWFAACVNHNHKRRAMRVDYKTVSSDGFMINVTSILDQLCEPFMDASFSKISKIDFDYLRRQPRVDISDETKINADQKQADDFYGKVADGTSNFISEVFFLTVASHHYGTECAQERMVTLQKTVKRMEKDLEGFEAERHKYINDPRYLARFEEHVNRIKQTIDDNWSVIHSTNGVLLDDISQARSMQFMRYVILWTLRIASGQNLPNEELKLPLPDKQREIFRMLPEYFLEDIVDNFKFITSHIPQILTSTQCEEVMQVCITFLRSTEYVKNPGVKSGLVSILFYGVMPMYRGGKGVLGDLLNGSSFAHKHLLHALMRFYIECESTGSHTQFYDKFNIRYEIFQVIKSIWTNTIYRDSLAREARVNTDFFVQFVNMIVNDATFVLDESLSSFVKIHDLTIELDKWPHGIDEERRKEKEELLEDQRGKAKSYMGLVRETMETLILFTEALAGPFTMPEVVQRLTDMLDYNLDLMTGPKSVNLKIKNPEDFGFIPKQLLSDIMMVYQNLSNKQAFVQAIARDGRSYKPNNFVRAKQIMQNTAMKAPEELQVWQELADKVAATKAADEQEEEDLGEVPDEFLDPLLADLMTDPVILPTSGNTVDRAMIRSHLLSDPTDPFNRQPLRIEQVTPNTELKEQIEKWKAEKKAAKAAERAAANMDTT
ncbi:hypothetical protein K431DRAFT_225608 [Polychaeton citri CBS 116435]|uniref:U-box domain-containing protein n=1 Tax=Polychaeton citri CBS 116435 TaxID=1314669 RepID=A0A9P4UQ95_9PEZI|nr:hypothetical protein K431DRAFT_225608 [Polychaeton citri CBS 116435]